MASKEGGKSAAADSCAEDSIRGKFFWIGLLLISIGLIIGCYSENHNGSISPSTPIICGDAVSYRFSSRQRVIVQKVHKNCLSGLIFSPDISEGKCGIDAPGAVRICLWNNDRCVGWINTKNNNSQEPRKNEIPEYSAIRLIGDEGDAILRLR